MSKSLIKISIYMLLVVDMLERKHVSIACYHIKPSVIDVKESVTESTLMKPMALSGEMQQVEPEQSHKNDTVH